MTPAAIYVRVSKEDGSQTTDNQLPDVQQMATGRGYVVAPEYVYSDEASGAKGADERPALAALLQAAARGRFKAVFVWRLDRLSRDDTFRGGLAMVADLDRFGVALLSHQETWIDTAGPFRSVLVQISLTLAAEERRVLVTRTKAGIARAKAQGVHCGRPRALLSDAILLRAREIRAGLPAGGYGETYRRRERSWRDVHALLIKEGYQNVPSFPTLARACTKAPVKT